MSPLLARAPRNSALAARRSKLSVPTKSVSSPKPLQRYSEYQAASPMGSTTKTVNNSKAGASSSPAARVRHSGAPACIQVARRQACCTFIAASWGEMRAAAMSAEMSFTTAPTLGPSIWS